MKKLEIDEIKRRQLKILVSVDEFCCKNNIRYFLCGGTLLGAVRHKGYIPWDDDIDISMPRPDYEKFISSYADKAYSIITARSENNYLGLFTKISDNETILEENGDFGEKYGVNIDLFPVDGLPASNCFLKCHIKWMKFLQGFVVSAITKNINGKSLIRKIEIKLIRFLLLFIRNKQLITKFAINQAKKYKFDNSDKVAVVVWGYGAKEVVPRNVAVDYDRASFEGLSFNIPRNYDVYLSSLYGDYMKLPPEDKRVSKHGITVYKKNIDYEDSADNI